MFWFIIVFAAIVALATPWTFKYLVMTPFLGFGLGGFTWSITGLLWSTQVVTVNCFLGFVVGGMVVVGTLIHKFDQ